MSNGGLISGHGFEYQKAVFLYYALMFFHAFDRFLYEGQDDIECTSSLAGRSFYIQSKTGNCSDDVKKNVLLNWLNVNNYKNSEFVLFTEFPIDFEPYGFKESIKSLLLDAHNHRSDSNVRKAFENLFVNDFNYEHFDCVYDYICEHFSVRTRGYVEIEKDLYDAYKINFINREQCDNFQIVNRVDSFYDYVLSKIGKSLAASKMNPILFTAVELTQENERIASEFPINKYSEAKSKSIFNDDAYRLLEENTREVKQLRAVFSKESRILDELINEVFYKDFKKFYLEINMSREIDSLEGRAYHNYIYSLDEFDDDTIPSPRDLFNKTMNKSLDDKLLAFDDGMYCRRGCYTFLTSDEVKDELRISWDVSNNDFK